MLLIFLFSFLAGTEMRNKRESTGANLQCQLRFFVSCDDESEDTLRACKAVPFMGANVGLENKAELHCRDFHVLLTNKHFHGSESSQLAL